MYIQLRPCNGVIRLGGWLTFLLIRQHLGGKIIRLAMSPEGRTRAAAGLHGTIWQIQDSDIISERVRVFVDLINPVTPENTRAIMQTDVFSGDEWIGNVVTNITIAAAWHWCEANAEAILAQKPVGERWSHWDCLKTGNIPAKERSLAEKIGCR